LTEAVLADWRTAPVPEGLRATLGFVAKLTLEPDAIGPDDVAAVRSAGVSDEAIVDAVCVCTLFNTIDRIADSLSFRVPPREESDRIAPQFLARGYR
jgi:alkylhydroperoxidase family enzyme